MNYSLLFGIEVTVNHIEIYLPLVVCVAWHGTCGAGLWIFAFLQRKRRKNRKKKSFLQSFEPLRKIEKDRNQTTTRV